jgi:hypothetical protein
VTPVYKLSASSVTGRTNYGSMLAGNPAFELPGDFESIATVSVGGGGAAYVEFTSIPALIRIYKLEVYTEVPQLLLVLFMLLNTNTMVIQVLITLTIILLELEVRLMPTQEHLNQMDGLAYAQATA